MLIKTKLRREKKKRGEDIHARGGEGKRKKERKKERDVGVFYIKGREEEEEEEEEKEAHLLRNEGFQSFYWGILSIVLLMNN